MNDVFEAAQTFASTKANPDDFLKSLRGREQEALRDTLRMLLTEAFVAGWNERDRT